MTTEDEIRLALDIREKAEAIAEYEAEDESDIDKPTLTAARRLLASANSVLGRLYDRDREQQRRR